MQKNLPIQGDYTSLAFNEDYSLVFTKREVDSLPVTQTRVEKRPCLDPSWSSDFLYDGFTNREMYAFVENKVYLETEEFYPNELDRWHISNETGRYFVERCEAEHEFDPRYKDAGQGQLFYTEEHV